jgi:hypothetical protein
VVFHFPPLGCGFGHIKMDRWVSQDASCKE